MRCFSECAPRLLKGAFLVFLFSKFGCFLVRDAAFSATVCSVDRNCEDEGSGVL